MLLLNFISYFKCMVLYVYNQEVYKQKVLDTMYINVFVMSLREGNIAILVSITKPLSITRFEFSIKELNCTEIHDNGLVTTYILMK